MKKLNKQTGITLVALIITIIVLLILAVVTIASVTGDGIINHAENARDAYKTAQEDENSILKYYEDYLDRNAMGSDNPNSLVAKFKAGELKVGDYVDYKPAKVTTAYDPDNGTAGSRTGYTEEVQSFTQEDLNWRVLGYDETKNQILLISGTPTTDGILNLKGRAGYNNGEKILDDICKALYSNSSIGATARSISMKDIDTYLGGNAFDKTTFKPRENEDSCSYGFTQNFTDIYTPESGTEKWSGSLTSNMYSYSASEVITDTEKQNIITGKNIFDDGYLYWMVSRSCEVDNNRATWAIGGVCGDSISNNCFTSLYYSNGEEYYGDGCLRPVVSLSSKVDINQVPKLETAPTETWEDPIGWF